MTNLSDLFGGTPTMKTDLVDWFTLNETSGNRFGAHAEKELVDTNTVTSAAGKIGNAASFARTTSEWLDGSALRGFEGRNSDFSVACWINATTLGADYYAMVGNVSGAAQNFWAWSVSYDHPTGKPRFVMGNGSTWKVALGPSALSTATWYHLYCQFNATTQNLGISVNNGALQETALAGVPQAVNNGFAIGHEISDTRYWDGLIDEVPFYGRLLTTDQQSWLYNSANGRTYSDIT